uniref:Uncharacterized protein n=1 Tax=Rhizophora mucronata TaxID=61149 RepID=A0A2P2QFX1_RHIMU
MVTATKFPVYLICV